MGNQTEDPRRSGQGSGSQQKGARVGQPGEQQRTSQQNAGSTEGGGTRNAGNSVERITEKSREGNSIERMTEDDGAGRDQQAGSRTDHLADDLDDTDIERAGRNEGDEKTPGSRPR
jgi:hypothetical protein